MTASARYLYCVLPADDAAPAVCAPALDGGLVHSIRHRDIAVLAHACAPEPYQGSEAEVCNWIAAHNAVIEEAWKSAGTVLPMSFDVIVRGDCGRSAEANVAGWLEEHHAALRRRLQALRGRVEVGVQILRDAENPAAGEAGEAESPGCARAGTPILPVISGGANSARGWNGTRKQFSSATVKMLAALVDDVHVNKLRPVQGKMMMLNLSLLTDRRPAAGR